MFSSSLMTILADFGPSLGVVSPFLPVPLLAATLLVMSHPTMAVAAPRFAMNRRRQLLAFATSAGPARAFAIGVAVVVFTAWTRAKGPGSPFA